VRPGRRNPGVEQKLRQGSGALDRIMNRGEVGFFLL
jgi:hypothetical protein